MPNTHNPILFVCSRAYPRCEVRGADKKFTEKILRVTGVIDRVTANDTHGIYYIILTGAEKRGQWNIRCTFSRKYRTELSRLVAAQKVIVEGKYDGYRANILMKDCSIIS